MNFYKKYKPLILSVIVLIIGFIITFSMIKTLKERSIELREQKKFAAHENAIEEIKRGVENLNLLATGVRAYIKEYPVEITDTAFFKFIQSQIENSIYKDSVAVSLIDTNQYFKISVTRSEINPVGLVGKSVFKVRKGKDFNALNKIIKDESIALVDPFNLEEGWAGIAINQGIHKNNIPLGYVAVVVNLQHILNGIYKSKEYSEFTHRFITKQGFEFDRVTVFDGNNEPPIKKDDENYRNFNINESDFLTSNLNIYGLKLKVSTAYKQEPLIPTYLYLYLVFIAISLGIIYIIYQNDKAGKLNAQLKILRIKEKRIHEDTMSSINYAKRIQVGFIPKIESIKEKLKDVFIFFKPKDIVSGDFYWFDEVNNKQIIAAIDCTGHGVPGALMTSIANGILNNIILGDKITDPALILEKLDKRIIQILNQEQEASNDGMDAAFCVIDKEKKQVDFSGAFRPMYVIRDKELIEFKGDRFPVGGLNLENKRTYTTQTLNYQSGDSIYIFSDGYPDQFGGEKGKKFKTSQFKKLLISNAHKSMEEQQIIIENTFNDWMGTTEQTDDVLLIGFKL